MRLRPTDDTGDILPVKNTAALLAGTEAAAEMVRCSLNLLPGEWWENPDHGCAVFRMLREDRLTAEGKTALAAYLTAYIHATPGIRAVDRVSAAVTGRQFAFSCEIRTEDGTADVSFSLST
ncbi:MAG: hypothetical protein IJL36_02095 [Clostridia bacterium]|nr:hypothetical protein [Clostridia bacterium]